MVSQALSIGFFQTRSFFYKFIGHNFNPHNSAHNFNLLVKSFDNLRQTMIKRIFVDNYKCFANFEVSLNELTLLIGPNGSGKSSILDIVFAIRSLLSGEAKINSTGIFHEKTLTRWQTRRVQAVEIDVEVGGEIFCYRIEVDHQRDTGRARVQLERLSTRGGPLFEFVMGEVHLYRDNHSQGPTFSAEWSESALARIPSRPDNQLLTAFLETMRGIVVCGFYPKGFSAEAKAEDALLDREGENFAAWYRYIVQERQDLIPDFIGAIREVIDGFKTIRLEKVGLESRALTLIFEREDNRYELRLDEISDGQRTLLALYALIQITGEQGYPVFFDEPDNYVALQEIQPWLMALLEASGSKIPQAVICSHHPEILDYVGLERSILMKIESTGIVTARPAKTLLIKEGLKFSEVVARGWEQ